MTKSVLLALLSCVALAQMSHAAASNTLLADQFELVFAPQGITATSLPLTVNLSNSGATPIGSFVVSISGANAAEFAYTNSCTVLPSTQSCAIQVTFTPAASGVRTATLQVSSTGTPSPLSVSLQGEGSNPNTVLQASPASLQMSQPVKVTAEVSINVVYNPAPGVSTPLTVSAVQIQGSNAADYQLASAPSTCGAVDPNCFVNIYFTPGALGARPATLVLNTSAGNLSVPLNGTGIDPTITISLSAGSLVFNAEGLSVPSVPQAITIQATGTNPVVISSVSVSGTNSADFAASGNCGGATINPVTSAPPACTINITFTPNATGLRSATLTINDNAVGGPHSVSLTGTGVNTSASLLVGNVTQTGSSQYGATNGILPATDFGNVLVLQQGTNVNRILNTGTTAVAVSETFSGANVSAFTLNPFADPTDCAAAPTLAPNASCNSTIGFTPQVAGLNSAVLTVSDSVSGVSQTFNLVGVGLTGTKLAVFQKTDGSPIVSQGFGTATVGTAMQGFVQIANVGTEPVTVGGTSFAGSNAADFAVLGLICPSGTSVLQPGDVCQATVRFKPSGQGYRTAMLNIVDDAQNGQSLFVTGAGAPNLKTPYISSAPVNTAAIDFSVTPFGTTAYSSNIRFTNFGNGLVTISQLPIVGTNAGDFAVYENTCGTTLSPKQYCDIYIQYTPSVTGAEVAYLTLVNNSPYGNVVVALYGFGYTPTNSGVYVTPSAVSFGVPGGYQTSTASIQLGNPGGAPLTIQSATVTGPDASDFTAQTPACLSAENACTIPLNFFSGSTTSEAATLTIVTSAGTLSVPLTGNAAAPAPALRYQNPVSISAAGGTTTVFNEIIYQIGTQPLLYSVNTPAFTGKNAADFAVGTLSCDSTKFTCSLPILFTPSVKGPETATLTLNTASTPLTITVNGLGQ